MRMNFNELNKEQQKHAIQVFKDIRQSEIQDELGSNVDFEELLNNEVAEGMYTTLFYEPTSDSTVFAYFTKEE